MRNDLPFGEAEQWIVIALIITYIPAAVAADPIQLYTIPHNGFCPRKTAGQSMSATNVLSAMPMR
jgi:hypothetical protein